MFTLNRLDRLHFLLPIGREWHSLSQQLPKGYPEPLSTFAEEQNASIEEMRVVSETLSDYAQKLTHIVAGFEIQEGADGVGKE